jgi:hypothetical protein
MQDTPQSRADAFIKKLAAPQVKMGVACTQSDSRRPVVRTPTVKKTQRGGSPVYES